MSNEVLDTDFLPLDMITTAEGCANEITKCDELRLALSRHQYELVKLYAKLTNNKVVRTRSNYLDVVIDDYCVVDKHIDKNCVSLAESLHYDVVDYGDGQIEESEDINV